MPTIASYSNSAQRSLDGRLKKSHTSRPRKITVKRVHVEANFVFVVVRARALLVGTEYLELGAKTELYSWAVRDNYESSAC